MADCTRPFVPYCTALYHVTKIKEKEMVETMENTAKEKSSVMHKVLLIVGAVFCVILIPILIINVTLIIKSYTNKDEVPKVGGYCPLIILTGSMEPQIYSGDLIIVHQIDPKDVKVGDIIAFFDPDGNGTSVLTHRVTEVLNENGTLSYKTKGDANNAEDRLAVKSDKLIGIYQMRLAGMGHVAMFMQTPAGLIICVVVPLILLVGYDLLRRRRSDRRNQKDTDALLAELAELKAQRAAEAEAGTSGGENAAEETAEAASQKVAVAAAEQPHDEEKPSE